MCKGDIKMVLNFLFSSIQSPSLFEEKIDFEEETSKPLQSLFSDKVEITEESESNDETN